MRNATRVTKKFLPVKILNYLHTNVLCILQPLAHKCMQIL